MNETHETGVPFPSPNDYVVKSWGQLVMTGTSRRHRDGIGKATPRRDATLVQDDNEADAIAPDVIKTSIVVGSRAKWVNPVTHGSPDPAHSGT